jgi:hypothetical protein
MYNLVRDTKGGIAAITALFLAVAVSAMAIAIDLGRIFLVRCELQRAADAGAMAAAVGLLPIPPGTTGPVGNITPDCNRSRTTSQQVVAANTADGGSLTLPSADVIFGTWDMTSKSFAPVGCGNPNQVTAVKVLTRKDHTINGPVPLSFSYILSPGMTEKEMTAEAIGLMGFAGNAPQGVGTFPLAVDRDKVPPNNTPFRIHLNPTPGDEGCWHSYKDSSSSTSTTRDYIDGTKPTPEINVGDNINVKEGVADSALAEVSRQLAQRSGEEKTYDVLVPIIPANSSHSGWQPVEGFATLRITEVETRGSDKYVGGYIVPDYVAPGVGPGGPNFGTRAAVPKMVQ